MKTIKAIIQSASIDSLGKLCLHLDREVSKDITIVSFKNPSKILFGLDCPNIFMLNRALKKGGCTITVVNHGKCKAGDELGIARKDGRYPNGVEYVKGEMLIAQKDWDTDNLVYSKDDITFSILAQGVIDKVIHEASVQQVFNSISQNEVTVEKTAVKKTSVAHEDDEDEEEEEETNAKANKPAKASRTA